MAPAMRFVIAMILLVSISVPRSANPADRPALLQESVSVRKFTIPEHDLYPENIAYDSVSGCYFLGSMSHGRILCIHENGSYDDFLLHPDTDLLSVIGMKVDARRRRLWVCTGRFSLFENYQEAPAQTGVMLFDIETKSLIRKWLMPQESDYHIFNDLVLAANGDAYATTTLKGSIYRISPTAAEMVLVHQLDAGRHNNGLAFDPSERFLFVTVDRSIFRLELSNGNLVKLAVPGDEALGSDGIYFHDNSLLAVKPRTKRICRLFLNSDMTAVDRVETLAQDHPDFAYPTTGVLVGDKLVFVATSYADVPRKPGAEEQHPDVLIHEVSLAR